MLNHEQKLDAVFRALAEPARRAIVLRLSRGSASVSELAEPMAMSLAAVVQHVQALEQSGLVKTHKEGRVRRCTLDPQAISLAESWLSERRQQWETHFDRLGALFAADTDTPPTSERKS
ncbi:ArsR family transcriptional regulator [Pseudoduganella flava]|uniref:ArsR family transcriptional regulator n=1 Tax=Pseudoduganella flava TaxID=871742 RepID=A0A562PMX8_9BURK|nr:metalloregulator ArsR/SmtB family transcription factor [Pseudoduganella flava]TWI45821.1 ArsR family transcriptional regulator [Pseudoduganella flava]